jgi:hypothetical protein
MTQPLTIKIGPRFMADLQNDDLDFIKALNELIANSIDSWIDCGKNKNERSSKVNKLKIEVNYDFENKSISILDNSVGMTYEELNNSMSFGVSSKEKSKQRKSLMGMYGYGMKGATSAMGGHLEIVTKKKNKNNFNHAVWEIEKSLIEEEMLVTIDSDDGKGNENTQLDESLLDKLSKKTSQGTLVYISSLHDNLNPEDYRDELETNWMWFLQDNEFGKSVEITFQGVKLKMPKLGKKDIDPVPFSTVELSVPITWTGDRFDKNSKNERQTGKKMNYTIKGKIWLNHSGGFQSGGFSLFRNLQNIAFRDKTEWKRRSERGLYAGLGGWWNNETWLMEGYLHLDSCIPNQPKTYFNTKTNSWKAADKVFQNYLPKSLVHSKTGINKKLSDEHERNKFLANEWWPWFINKNPELKLPEELEAYVDTKEPPEKCPEGFEWDPVKKECVEIEEPPEKCPEGFEWDPVKKECVEIEEPPEVKEFEVVSEEVFILNDHEWQIVVIKGAAGNKIYDWKDSDYKLQININSDLSVISETLKSELEKIVKNTTAQIKLSRNLIIRGALQDFLYDKLGKDLTKAKNYANIWLTTLFKNDT